MTRHISCIDRIQKQRSPLQAQIAMHPIIYLINPMPAVGIFMPHHVFAGWDFFCSLKNLFARLVSSSTAWLLGQNFKIACRFAKSE